MSSKAECKSFMFLGNNIDVHIKEKIYVCITDALKSLNDIRVLKGYANARIDDRLSFKATNELIKHILRCNGSSDTNPIKTISDLKKNGFAYRSGKGNGQKWFVEYRVFIAIFSTIDDSISNKIMSCIIDSIDPFVIFDKLSKIENIKERNANLNTYIAIDRSKNICKVGKTIDLRRRLSSLRVSNKNIEYIYTIDKDIESDMHKLLNGFKIEGEWYNMDEDMISGIAVKYGFKKFSGFTNS